jgi:SAM-dependent methyltransferase
MTYVFQPARYELERQIERHASKVIGRVLDVGSGSHSRYRGFFRDCTKYVKLDIEGVPDVDVHGSAESIPLPDNSFDSIVSTQVIGDVFDLEKAFSEFIRVLKPGGVLLLTEGFMDPLHDEPYDYWRFTAHSLRRLAADAGFEVELVEKRGGYFSVRAQMLIRYYVNRYDIYRRSWRRLFSLFARQYGLLMIARDRRDKSEVNRHFGHGFLLLAHKPR